jgi:hypothetical protein
MEDVNRREIQSRESEPDHVSAAQVVLFLSLDQRTRLSPRCSENSIMSSTHPCAWRLPSELTQMVLSHLDDMVDFYQAELGRMMLVCREWKVSGSTSML